MLHLIRDEIHGCTVERGTKFPFNTFDRAVGGFVEDSRAEYALVELAR